MRSDDQKSDGVWGEVGWSRRGRVRLEVVGPLVDSNLDVEDAVQGEAGDFDDDVRDSRRPGVEPRIGVGANV